MSSASHDCAMNRVPGAVNEYESRCGMPWSRIQRPVVRCTRNELSCSRCRPIFHPPTANAAVKAAASVSPCRRAPASAAPCSAGPPERGARESESSTAMDGRPLEAVRDGDERGTQHDHEDRGKDAEHEREE